MTDPNADTRTTVSAPAVQALALCLGLPLETDPSVIVRKARERITRGGLSADLTLEEWLALGDKYRTTARDNP